jgi:solute:Na+ symporter, SSS family
MTVYDYAVLAFYFGFMLAMSWVFRRFVHNVSDYFRGGAKALWWMVGGSAFMVQFSAWTFTGAASKAYSDGWPIIAIYIGNAIGFLINAFNFGPKFRQLRVTTSIEAVRLRFGRASEQVFTWLQLPFGTIQAGVWLNSLGVFFSAVFGLDLTLTIIGTGIVVLIIALLGGSWAVLAGDFIQMLILMTVCLATTVLAILHLGGIHAFVHQLPPAHLDLGQIFSKDFLGLWCVAMLLKQFTSTNNLNDANRYLCVKDSRHARWAAFFAAGLFVIGIFIWFIPPMAARALIPDLHALYPTLKNPEEASFIAVARIVMPVGMIGLLVSGIFASTMSTMDAGLNRNAGVFIKNFYQPVLRPHSSDAQLLRVGKTTTAILGVIVIFTALRLSQLNHLNLFLLTQRTAILIGIPITVPLLLGMIVKRTPPWSAWSTVFVGFVGSLVIDSLFTPEWAARHFGVAGALDPASREYWLQAIQFFGNVILASTWFLGTKFFWNRTSAAERTMVEEYFVRFNTPVDFAKEEGAHAANDERQETAVGWLCLAYGGFVSLLALIPNPLIGRLAFVGCGGLVAAVGAILLYSARQTSSHHENQPPHSSPGRVDHPAAR